MTTSWQPKSVFETWVCRVSNSAFVHRLVSGYRL